MSKTRLFGLIGFPLTHSFSKLFFSEKFQHEGITDATYDLFPLPSILALPDLLERHPNLCGLNVTIPYKQAVLPFLQHLTPSAEAIGAVNTIKIEKGRWVGENTDAAGFEASLLPILKAKYGTTRGLKALILGSGGAGKAVRYVLQRLQIEATVVSRTGKFTYSQLTPVHLADHLLIINATPLGMSPHPNACPDLTYEALTPNHLLYDLVYNPTETLFLKKGIQQGATIKNGLEMLYLQAEKAWEFWNYRGFI